jgi:hypothetical protein
MRVRFLDAVAGSVGVVAGEDLLGHAHDGHGFRPTRVEGQVGDHFDELLLARFASLGEAKVMAELLGVSTSGQARDGDQAAFLWGQLATRPDLPEQDVVGEAEEGRGEVPRASAARRTVPSCGPPCLLSFPFRRSCRNSPDQGAMSRRVVAFASGPTIGSR